MDRFDFLRELSKIRGVLPGDVALFDQARVRTFEQAYALILSFPSLAGTSRARLTSVLASRALNVTARGAELRQILPEVGLGAEAPETALYKVGQIAPPGAAGGNHTPSLQAQLAVSGAAPLDDAASGAGASQPNLKVVANHLLNWPVRYQGLRGTCVAHAVVASLEQAEGRSSGALDAALSEQFLFWAAKVHGGDPHPESDGTFIHHARAGLKKVGVCVAEQWPYSSVVGPSVTYAAANVPSADVLNAAKTRQSKESTKLAGAAEVLRALEKRHTVALSLPVFRDPEGVGNNWLTTTAIEDGEVLDPQENSECIGGHAVCVTGFIPADDEDLGGYFVVRNSWGLTWGKTTLLQGLSSPGYGRVSASYVERYQWEAYAFLPNFLARRGSTQHAPKG
jgi:hypothetical protein